MQLSKYFWTLEETGKLTRDIKMVGEEIGGKKSEPKPDLQATSSRKTMQGARELMQFHSSIYNVCAL